MAQSLAELPHNHKRGQHCIHCKVRLMFFDCCPVCHPDYYERQGFKMREQKVVLIGE